MNFRILLILYWLAALLNIIGGIVGNDLLRAISKPLLMVLLGAYYFLATKEKRTTSHWLVFVGFIFSWSGDVNLMFVHKQEYFFLLGLVSFLITHIMYIIAFYKDSKAGESPRLLRAKPYIAIPIIAAYLSLLLLLYGHIEEAMDIPVKVYASVITLMVLTSLNRFNRVSSRSFQLVFLGAVTFMISDSMIAINKFYQPFDWASTGIMATYITAQYLIAQGTLKTT